MSFDRRCQSNYLLFVFNSSLQKFEVTLNLVEIVKQKRKRVNRSPSSFHATPHSTLIAIPESCFIQVANGVHELILQKILLLPLDCFKTVLSLPVAAKTVAKQHNNQKRSADGNVFANEIIRSNTPSANDSDDFAKQSHPQRYSSPICSHRKHCQQIQPQSLFH